MTNRKQVDLMDVISEEQAEIYRKSREENARKAQLADEEDARIKQERIQQERDAKIKALAEINLEEEIKKWAVITPEQNKDLDDMLESLKNKLNLRGDMTRSEREALNIIYEMEKERERFNNKLEIIERDFRLSLLKKGKEEERRIKRNLRRLRKNVKILEEKKAAELTNLKRNKQKSDKVYCVKSENTFTYKIGICSDLEKRINGLQTGNSNNIIAVGLFTASNADKWEKAFHLFHKKRGKHIIREWFNLTEEDVTNFNDEKWRNKNIEPLIKLFEKDDYKDEDLDKEW